MNKKKIIIGVISFLGVCLFLFGVFVFLVVRNFSPQGQLKVDGVREMQKLTNLQEAVRNTPDDPAAHMNYADYLLSGFGFFDPDKALKHYLKAVELAPEDPQILKRVGWALNLSNKNSEAIRLAEKIPVIAPSMAQDAYKLLAHSYYQSEEYERAVEYFEKLSPPEKSAKLGAAYFHIGRYEESLKIFQVFPSRKQIPRNKAYGLRADESGVAYYYMGKCYLKTGRKKEAKKAFREALALFRVANGGWRQNQITEIQNNLKKM